MQILHVLVRQRHHLCNHCDSDRPAHRAHGDQAPCRCENEYRASSRYENDHERFYDGDEGLRGCDRLANGQSGHGRPRWRHYGHEL